MSAQRILDSIDKQNRRRPWEATRNVSPEVGQGVEL